MRKKTPKKEQKSFFKIKNEIGNLVSVCDKGQSDRDSAGRGDFTLVINGFVLLEKHSQQSKRVF